MDNALLLTPKSDTIASIRYIYYPDHLIAVQVANAFNTVAHVPAPSNFSLYRLWNLLQTITAEPLFQGLFSGILKCFISRRQPHIGEDDSVGNLLRRLLGEKVAENIGSAVIHGLYAGDMNQLSARALTSGLWSLEKRISRFKDYLSFRALQTHRRDRTLRSVENQRSIFEAMMLENIRNGPAGELEKRNFEDVSVFSFTGGIGHLTDRLGEALRQTPNVHVLMNTRVESISQTREGVTLKVER